MLHYNNSPLDHLPVSRAIVCDVGGAEWSVLSADDGQRTRETLQALTLLAHRCGFNQFNSINSIQLFVSNRKIDKHM
jgi:hypothetical protein